MGPPCWGYGLKVCTGHQPPDSSADGEGAPERTGAPVQGLAVHPPGVGGTATVLGLTSWGADEAWTVSVGRLWPAESRMVSRPQGSFSLDLDLLGDRDRGFSPLCSRNWQRVSRKVETLAPAWPALPHHKGQGSGARTSVAVRSTGSDLRRPSRGRLARRSCSRVSRGPQLGLTWA